MNKNNIKELFLIPGLIVLFFYLPVIVNPKIILERNNDLQEYFLPIINFVKKRILQYGELPLWYPNILSGTSLVTDPQSPIFYPLNILHLILPISTSTLVLIIVHSIIGAIGITVICKKILKLHKFTTALAVILYTSQPIHSGSLQAGHLGIIYAHGWIPCYIYSLISLSIKPKIKKTIPPAIFLTFLSLSHTPTFLIILLLTPPLFFLIKKPSKKSLMLIIISLALSLAISSIALLPQTEIINKSNRIFLLNKPELHPQWKTKTEFLTTVFLPWLHNIHNIDTEKWIPVGIISFLIALYGLKHLNTKTTIIAVAFLLINLALAANNLTPINLSKINFFALLRVTTRFWFINSLIIIILTTTTINRLLNKYPNKKYLIYSLALLTAGEYIFLSWLYLHKPIISINKTPEEIISFIKQDEQKPFRIFCTNKCISPLQAVEHDLELIEGYNTIIQENYYKQAWQLTGIYWDYYTLSIPPLGRFSEIKPDPVALGNYNVKYIISPKTLDNPQLDLVKKTDEFLIYKNTLYQERANIPIINYSANQITLQLPPEKTKQIILADVYSPGWQAYTDNSEALAVLETPIGLRAINPPTKPAKILHIYYEPPTLKLGMLITLLGITATVVLLRTHEK